MTEEQKKDLYKPEFRDYNFVKEHSFARPATLGSRGVQGSSQPTDQQSKCIGVAEFYQVFCLAKFYFIIFALSSRVVREVLCRSEQIPTLGPLLSSKKFDCVINLFHSDGCEERQYCFEPEPKDPVDQGFTRRPSIFLKSELKNDNGQFWFQWYKVTTKVSRTNSLFSALHNWLGQEEIRPISAHLLGVNDRDFTSKCSKIWRLAQAEKAALLVGKHLVVP